VGGELTRDGLDLLGEAELVATRCGAEGFVSDSEEDDYDEGDEEGGGGADVPLAEDDAEVLCVPGEEHLSLVSLLPASMGRGRDCEKRTFMLHIGSMPPSPPP
jgi:hypothetical protein